MDMARISQSLKLVAVYLAGWLAGWHNAFWFLTEIETSEFTPLLDSRGQSLHGTNPNFPEGVALLPFAFLQQDRRSPTGSPGRIAQNRRR